MLCAVKSSSSSPIDELENFAMGKVNASTYTVNRNGKDAHAAGVNHQNTVDDLDSFFNAGPRSKSVPRSRTTTPVRRIQHHRIFHKRKKNMKICCTCSNIVFVYQYPKLLD